MHTSRASAVACGEWETSLTPPSKFPRTPILFNFSQEQPPVTVSVGRLCFFFCCVPIFILFLFLTEITGRSQEGFLSRYVQDSGCNWSDSTKFPPLITAWVMRGLLERKSPNPMFEWTKEEKASVLPPKWRKILCQQQHVSLLNCPIYVLSWVCLALKKKKPQECFVIYVIYVLCHIVTVLF